MPGVRITRDDLKNRFTYHAPYGDQAQSYQEIRAAGFDLAELIVNLCPPGRQTSLAVTAVEEAVMRANAAVAQDTPVPGFDGGIKKDGMLTEVDPLLSNVCPECGGTDDFHTAECSAHATPTDPHPADRSAAEE